MPRPINGRRITGEPGARVYRPAGVPVCRLKWLALTLDEFEALRLSDVETLSQAEAAKRMDVSQPTFNRILSGARYKTARALTEGVALKIMKDPAIADGSSARSQAPKGGTVK